MNPARMSFASFGVLLISVWPVRADTVVLRNGAAIDGIIAREDDHGVTLKIGENGQIRISLRDVARIDRNARGAGSKESGGETPPAHPAPPVTPPASPETPQPGGAEPPAVPPAESPVPPAAPPAEKGVPAAGEIPLEGKGAGPSAGAPEIRPEQALKPAEREEIESLVLELARQRARNRVRAENRLRAMGTKAVPFLLPLLQASAPATRAAAMRILADSRDERIVEPAIARLRDDDPFVREAAIQALRRIAGHDLGYAPRGSDSTRAAAVARWERWWADRRAEAEKKKPPSKP